MDDHDYGRMLVVQHSPEVHLAGMEQMLTERSVLRPFEVVDATAGLPEIGEDVRGVLVLGGLMGVPDREQHPWMQAELDWLAAAHDAGTPLLGICLGAQLLGQALGGEVRRREAPECGIFGLTRTDAAAADPVFAGWPSGGHVVLTHEDEVATLPEGAELMLAPSGSGPDADGPAAWRLGETTFAVQFHPEIDPDLVAGWLAAGLDDQCARADVDASGLAEQIAAEARFLRGNGLGMVGRWVDAVVGKGDPSPRKHRR